MLDLHMYPAHILNVTLDEYLTTTKTSEAAFGAEIGLSQSQVNRIRYGDSWPPKAVMERIGAATGEKVAPNDFLVHVPKPRRTKVAEELSGDAA